MKWLTNAAVRDTDRLWKVLLAGHPGRVICAGDPAPTEWFGVDELIQMGVVGVYEVAASGGRIEAPSAGRGLAEGVDR